MRSYINPWDKGTARIKKILVDLDILVYKCGFSSETRRYDLYLTSDINEGEEPIQSLSTMKEVREFLNFLGYPKYEKESKEYTVKKTITPNPSPLEAFSIMREMITDIKKGVGVDKASLYLSGSENYRNDIATIRKYKGNRKKESRPFWYTEIRRYAVEELGAIITEGQEADDELSIVQCNSKDGSTCIATIDKDLNNTPGWHYNIDSKDMYYITEEESLSNFYHQLLIGDSTDNIQGVPGVGVAIARKLLTGFSVEEYPQEVLEQYVSHVLSSIENIPDNDMNWVYDEASRLMLENGRLLWIRRERDQLWELPKMVRNLEF